MGSNAWTENLSNIKRNKEKKTLSTSNNKKRNPNIKVKKKILRGRWLENQKAS